MPKIIALALIVLTGVFLLASCNKKEIYKSREIINTTTRTDFRQGATGVTLRDASALAIRFLQSKNPVTTVTIKSAQTIEKNGTPYFHVINANRGFVLLSVDSLYCPILAYDSVGNFSCGNEYLNPGLLNWLNKHAHELDFVRNTQSKLIDSVGRLNKLLWRALGGALANSNEKPSLTGVA